MRRTLLFLFFLASIVYACGSNDDAQIPGPPGPDGGGGGELPDGGPFGGGLDGGACTPSGAQCSNATECCNLNCDNGTCSAAACIQDGQSCSSDGSCCGGKCTGGKCAPLNTTCKTAGNACSGAGDCCSHLCTGGKCALAASYCIQTGDVCARAEDCCGGSCNIATGATLGTCNPPPTGATYCNGGVDGTVCGDCNNCCSRLCAPYAPSGVKICQPANGCRVNGDLCRADKDCCGAAGTGLPGDGNVTCDKEPGAVVGICRNPRSCNPEGNVCHFKDYVCGGSSARNDCCGHLGSKTDCALDTVGVPRCHVVGVDGGLACRQTGETCAFSGNCCDGAKCLPDTGGVLRCAPPASQCSQTGNSCTVNADCCSGLSCNTPPGSVQGTCGATPSNDGGTCALYGQSCTGPGDCCNSVPCTGGFCVYKVN